MASPPQERFTAVAELYARHRPTYPPALIDWIEATTGCHPPARVADVGCGTGIATRLLAARGFDVVGIEPNDEMLAHARAAGGRYQVGEARATGLPDASVELVTVAQAFHWFEAPAAMAEFARILVPPGWATAFWNLRAEAGFNADYDLILREFSNEYWGSDKLDAEADIRAATGIANLREAELPFVEELTWERLHGRVHSASYVAHGVADKPGFDTALRSAFDKHASDGRVTVRYRSIALAWQFDRHVNP